MSTSIRYLQMFLHQPDGARRPIGYLSQYGDALRISFNEEYVADANRPILSLGFQASTEAGTVQILTAMRDARLVRNDGKWPVFLQNLLPEGHNRDRLATERRCSPDDEFELLAAAGHDLMGALEVCPVPADEGIPDVVRNWHTTLGLDVLEPGFVEFPVEDAAAIPGVVTKFSAVQDGRRYVVKRHGAAGSFILKLPSTAHPDLVQNEYTGYLLCRALGLNCAEASIISKADAELPEQVPFDDILAVKRFDRTEAGGRVHMEEFAQVLQYAPKNKYGKGIHEDYVTMLRIVDNLSANPVADVREFIRRFVAFILMGNTDAHLKNWALLYPDGHQPVLSPLYDPVCVTAFFEDSPGKYAVNREIDRRLIAFTWDDLNALFLGAQLARPQRLLEIAKATVKQAQEEWPAILAHAPESVRKSITERLNGGVALTRPSETELAA
jgi:serine/threonine-protein kinase HipA